MEKIFLILLVIVSLASCKKDNGSNVNPNSGQLASLEVDPLLPFLPLENMEGVTRVVFEDAMGEEKVYDIEITKKAIDREVNSVEYQADQIAILYSNPDDFYTIAVTASGNYSSVTASNLYIQAIVNQTLVPCSLSINEQGQPNFAFFYEQKDLLGQSFSNVFSNMFHDKDSAFGELYYNFEHGIIGFRDENGNLFVFKEYKS
ncbi:MAG: hypothetical protein RIC19_15870 [Phaeodactylibacter sp.]|uniref:hypothetical protein n=1 Tax=Phaeodactylibacter sp. TaxID=1940289 RepID=UPI0032ECD1FB